MLAKGPAVEEVQGVGSTAARAMLGKPAQGWNSTGNDGTVVNVGERDSGHTRCAAWRPDAVWLPRFVVE